MLDNKRHMLLCNQCRTGRCSKDTFKKYERFGDSSKCQLYDAPLPFRMPIITHLLADTNKINALHRTLDKYDLIFHETGKYPFVEFTKRRLRG
jgi:hypothetical protein